MTTPAKTKGEITEEYLDERLNHSMKVGESEGLKEAGGLLMEKALDAFKRGRDAEAKEFRAIAAMLEERGEKRHPGPPR